MQLVGGTEVLCDASLKYWLLFYLRQLATVKSAMVHGIWMVSLMQCSQHYTCTTIRRPLNNHPNSSVCFNRLLKMFQ